MVDRNMGLVAGIGSWLESLAYGRLRCCGNGLGTGGGTGFCPRGADGLWRDRNRHDSRGAGRDAGIDGPDGQRGGRMAEDTYRRVFPARYWRRTGHRRGRRRTYGSDAERVRRGHVRGGLRTPVWRRLFLLWLHALAGLLLCVIPECEAGDDALFHGGSGVWSGGRGGGREG